MAAADRIELPYRIRFDECGPDGNLRNSGFLRYAQDLAWVHAGAAGFGRDWYAARNLTWLIGAVELEVLDEIAFGETVIVSTEVLGFRRVWARRKSEFRRDGDERTLAMATIDWVLLNQRGAPVSVPREISDASGAARAATFTPLRIELPAAPPDAHSLIFAARRSELDPMRHVNNAAYIDYLDEQLADAGRVAQLARLPRRYRLEYVVPAEPGTELVGRGWQADLAWAYRLEDAAGRELVRARFETDPATWVGG